MDSEERSRLSEIFDSVIRAEETMKWLKENCDLQRACCEKHDVRITKLEIHGGRIRGIFATITGALVVLTTAITFLVSKFLWK